MVGVKAGPGRLALHVAVLIDGTGAPPLPDALITIEDGMIRSAGPAPSKAPGPRAGPGPELVTFHTGVAVPGFVDAHVHFTLFADGRSYEAMAAEPDAMMAIAAARADHIKIMASGGGTRGTDPARATYTVPELTCAAEAAHQLGLPTTAHCRASESMRRAIEAGLDCMEHGEFITPDGTRPFEPGLAARLVDSGMYLSPTLQANGWDTILRLRAVREARDLAPAEQRVLAAAEQDTQTSLDQVGRLAEMGLGPRIIAGTDAGCFDFSFGHIDYCLELMVAAGMSPMQALVASTSVAATACGIGDQVGTIQAGKRADIVILAASPLEDIRAVSRVLAVYKDGELVR